MRHILLPERLAILRLRLKCFREWLIELLRIRFRRVPKNIKNAINSSCKLAALKKLRKWAVTTDSLDNFPLK